MERNGTKVVVRDLCKAFGTNGAEKSVLRGLSLVLRSGEFTTIVGPNGCGKTTLLNLIAGLIQPDSGVCKVETTDGRQPQVGYVWQNYRASLLPWLSILENVAFPLRLRGQRRAEREQAALQLLERFMPGIDPRQPSYGMSGGQQQLVCLLRSATIQPDVLLLDEPFSALDQQRGWKMALYLERLWLERQAPTLLVSHDVDEAILLADRVLLMGQDGQIYGDLRNTMPRPRSIEMLTAQEHLRCRAEVVSFLLDGWAVAEKGVPPR